MERAMSINDGSFRKLDVGVLVCSLVYDERSLDDVDVVYSKSPTSTPSSPPLPFSILVPILLPCFPFLVSVLFIIYIYLP